jgi:hypothetical protein
MYEEHQLFGRGVIVFLRCMVARRAFFSFSLFRTQAFAMWHGMNRDSRRVNLFLGSLLLPISEFQRPCDVYP